MRISYTSSSSSVIEIVIVVVPVVEIEVVFVIAIEIVIEIGIQIMMHYPTGQVCLPACVDKKPALKLLVQPSVLRPLVLTLPTLAIVNGTN